MLSVPTYAYVKVEMFHRRRHVFVRFAFASLLSLLVTSVACLVWDPETVPFGLLMSLFACLPALVYLAVEFRTRRKWPPWIGFFLGALWFYLAVGYAMLCGEPAVQSMAFVQGEIYTLACMSMLWGLNWGEKMVRQSV